MNDQISRQKLIEELEEELVTPSNPEKTELRTKYWNAGIGRAINIVQSQPPADQWIPCKTCDKRCDEWENSEI